MRNVSERLTREQRSALMSRVRNRNTKPEVTLRRALWASGVRGWRCHPKRVVGSPDLAWIGRRVAVFVDGAFWHGHPDYYWGQSGAFWDEKIARNRARDRRVNDELTDAGWLVVRLWDFEVEKDLGSCVERVEGAVRARGLGPGRLKGAGAPCRTKSGCQHFKKFGRNIMRH